MVVVYLDSNCAKGRYVRHQCVELMIGVSDG